MVTVMQETLIGTTEAAGVCEVERTTFFRWVQLGQIRPKVKVKGKTGAMLFDPIEVAALNEAKKAERAAKAEAAS
jgi:predicted site-specific integrase-resolvase